MSRCLANIFVGAAMIILTGCRASDFEDDKEMRGESELRVLIQAKQELLEANDQNRAEAEVHVEEASKIVSNLRLTTDEQNKLFRKYKADLERTKGKPADKPTDKTTEKMKSE